MKPKKSTVALINLAIFAVMVTLGVLSGNITGNYRIGTFLGMGLGIMGIIAYGYWREKTEALRDAKIHNHYWLFKRHLHPDK